MERRAAAAAPDAADGANPPVNPPAAAADQPRPADLPDTPERPRGPPGHAHQLDITPPRRPANSNAKYTGPPALKDLFMKLLMMSLVVTGDHGDRINVKLHFAILNWLVKPALTFYNIDAARAMTTPYTKWPLKQGSSSHVLRAIEAAVSALNEDQTTPKVTMLNSREATVTRAAETHYLTWQRMRVEVTLPTPYATLARTPTEHVIVFFLPHPDPQFLKVRFAMQGQPDYVLVYSPPRAHLGACNYIADRPCWIFEGSVAPGCVAGLWDRPLPVKTDGRSLVLLPQGGDMLLFCAAGGTSCSSCATVGDLVPLEGTVAEFLEGTAEAAEAVAESRQQKELASQGAAAIATQSAAKRRRVGSPTAAASMAASQPTAPDESGAEDDSEGSQPPGIGVPAAAGATPAAAAAAAGAAPAAAAEAGAAASESETDDEVDPRFSMTHPSQRARLRARRAAAAAGASYTDCSGLSKRELVNVARQIGIKSISHKTAAQLRDLIEARMK